MNLSAAIKGWEELADDGFIPKIPEVATNPLTYLLALDPVSAVGSNAYLHARRQGWLDDTGILEHEPAFVKDLADRQNEFLGHTAAPRPIPQTPSAPVPSPPTQQRETHAEKVARIRREMNGAGIGNLISLS